MIDRIGSCRIVEEIGSGGMSVVYKAVQESLNRTVAIKALKTSAAQDPQLSTRFEREALSVAALQHENIIHIFDFHKAHGSLFIVMEYVEGIDLYDLLDRCGRLPVDVAAIAAMQVARALDYAHYRGIVHRDIKPANVMVSHQGGVKLMDFGIARDQAFGDLTETGAGLGTPSYMSPEQILGDRVDPRSDQFSLGIVLYQMVTGQKPFVEDEHKSVMHKIRLEEAPSPRRLNPEVPRELERIIGKCMEKLPRDRYRSTQDLVLALERFLGRRVEMNYNARLVLFLRNQGVLDAEQAEAFLHPAAFGGSQRIIADGGGRERFLRRTARAQLAVAAVTAGLVLAIHLVPQAPAGPPAATAAPPRPPAMGRVGVIARPWAEVLVDGVVVATTPFATPLEVRSGRRVIELRNPYYVTARRAVDVPPGGAVRLIVDLERAPAVPRAAP